MSCSPPLVVITPPPGRASLADAVLGAIAVEHGATVATLDRDFARFLSVDHVRPGA